ncbi:hypothetical protein [Nocardia fluminea]|uniref:Uncharacterized protein n=1 Tax=Nocardia fluminea TaxID=134984 RepID=A0A2N3V9Z5_9NOCA|nr:hypothetical protein [Nocardia fluminea]PKV78447.1 hypothetical protein ATK86_2816 [Nocardia fluminea]
MSYVIALAGFATILALAVSGFVTADASRARVRVRAEHSPRRR